MVCALAAACGGAPRPPAPPPEPAAAADPTGRHRDAIAALTQPYLDAELVAGAVVGITDAGRREIYGFGQGPGGARPTGRTVYELGWLTAVYTGLLLADAVQRREVDLDAPLADLLPPGVAVPTRDRAIITVRHLALHSAGLPPLPPSLAAGAAPDPFGGYTAERLYADLARTELVSAPGTRVLYSNYGLGVLGFAIGRRLGGYEAALAARVLAPLELRDTYLRVPAVAAARRASGTTDELTPAPPWTWDAMAAAGGVSATARDVLALLDAQLDAAAGGKVLPLRAPMRLTQEPQLEVSESSANAGLGWIIDGDGRYWQSGGTGGFRAFAMFDPKTKRGVVVLSSTASALVDRLGRAVLDALGPAPAKPWSPPTAAQLAEYAGTYDLGGAKLTVAVSGRRIYLEGEGAPRARMSPLSDHEFWIESLQAVAFFQRDGDRIARIVFGVGARQVVAPRVP
jgi:CubicO group peptidase (beta-lactamase class C family)